MSYIALTPFGAQPVTAELITARMADPAPCLPLDKWAVFKDLRVARKALGISDRDLTVLNALLTFLPARELASGAAQTVFPSNRALSERAHGMAESTLRRHLAALVAAGLIWRNDSPNGKRYARREESGAFGQCYGFDLTPLLHRAAEFADLARMIEAEASARHQARERVVLLLRDAGKLFSHFEAGLELSTRQEIEGTLAASRRALRRNLDLHSLRELDRELSQSLAQLLSSADRMSASAAQNERHLSNSKRDNKESEPPRAEPTRGNTDHTPDAESKEAPALPLGLVLSACTEITSYIPERPTNWREFTLASDLLRPMLGIPEQLWQIAKSTMGQANAAITLAAILQRFTKIANPGAYLRSLVQRANAGLFTPVRMVMALINGRHCPSRQS